MSSPHLDRLCRNLAIRLNPQYSVPEILEEAHKIRAFLDTNSSENIASLYLMYTDMAVFAETLLLDGQQLCLRDYQQDLLETWGTGDESLIIHARGMGMSLLLAVYALWLVAFHEEASVALVCANKAECANANQLISHLHKYCRFKLPAFTKYNKSCFEFANGNIIHFVTPDTYIVGRSLTHLLVDNAGYVSLSDDENIYSLFLMTSDQVVMCGTPNRAVGIFHDLVSSHTWFPTSKRFMPFTEYDAYDEIWEKQKREEMSYSDFESEYNCYFKPAYLY